ncbi:Crp/Fnr family transcriptional regulator [Roseibacterium sp. SDUM158017]|uniref:Crp/Fnr family transcriptional regulator n=1 Tax=Roseicyclus salinarum TaxID=3036773 RepID=UPI002414F16F|nr:Crp/Fnr family transcriptional regulator [Roseibacterium sp. SDUM158017]MDG4650310.1 Crp/Fnr family transcriptional regulator [Roseibacterium sp. SDUM158017]
MSVRPRQFSLPKGARVFSPGDPCQGFVSLGRGTIRVSLTAPNGREVVLYRVRPGDVCLQTFSCLINGTTYRAEGVAESEVSGVILPAPLFHDRMSSDKAFRADVFASVARRFGDFEQLVEDVALTGFDARLARVLLRLRGEGGSVTATHEQLAVETASGRAFVSRRLADFAARGLVRVGRGRIDIADAGGLERIAADGR